MNGLCLLTDLDELHRIREPLALTSRPRGGPASSVSLRSEWWQQDNGCLSRNSESFRDIANIVADGEALQ